jgi:hypothetical protein
MKLALAAVTVLLMLAVAPTALEHEDEESGAEMIQATTK